MLSNCALATLLVHPFDKCVISDFPQGAMLLADFFLFFLFFVNCPLSAALFVFTVMHALRKTPFKATAISGDAMTVSMLPSSQHTRNVNCCKLDGGMTATVDPDVTLVVCKVANGCSLLFVLTVLFSKLTFCDGCALGLASHPASRQPPVSFSHFVLLGT